MEKTIKYEKYEFVPCKSINSERPFCVKCLQTSDKKDSAISYEDAANLLIGQYKYTENVREMRNKDIKYIEETFKHYLLYQKKSKCDGIVENEIARQGIIKGIISIKTNPYEPYKEYRTEHFIIKVLFEDGLPRGANKIVVIRITK